MAPSSPLTTRQVFCHTIWGGETGSEYVQRLMVRTKRCLKNFTEENWNKCLASRNWAGVEESTDVNKMVQIFSENIIKRSYKTDLIVMLWYMHVHIYQ